MVKSKNPPQDGCGSNENHIGGDIDNVWTLLDQLKSCNLNGSIEKSSKSEHNENNKKDLLKDDEFYSQCNYCFSGEVILEKGCYVCQSCNVIVNKHIDISAEWRNFNNDDSRNADMTRCGMPTNDLLPDSSLGTVIGFSEKETHEIRLLRRYHLWGSMPYKERKLYNIFDTLSVKAVSHGITKNIIDEAKNLYRRFTDEKEGRGDNRNALVASSLYMACKINNVPRSAKEIAAIFGIKTTMMTKGCKKFQEIMGMNTSSSSASDFIPRFCCPLNLSQEFQDICKMVIQKVEDLDIACDNTPPSLAVSIVCFCAYLLHYDLDKKSISLVCGISQITINKCCNKLKLYKKEIVDDTLDHFLELHIQNQKMEMMK